jgi:biotin operon repressor
MNEASPPPPLAWHTPVITELMGAELGGILALGPMAATEAGDGFCALLDVFLGAKLEATEDGDGCTGDGNVGTMTFEQWSLAFTSEEKNQFTAEQIRAFSEDGDWTFRQRQGAESYFVDPSEEIGIDPNTEAKPFLDDDLLAEIEQEKREARAGEAAHAIRGGDFVRSYVPLSYSIEGVLPSGYLYGLTARRGDGKTAWLITTALATIKGDGEKILGFPVRKGRVAYIAKENPEDFKMKLAANCYIHNISWNELDAGLLVLDGRADSPEQICKALLIDAEVNGEFSLVIYDTFQAGFAAAATGKEFNDNAGVLSFVVRLRALTQIIGKPSGIIDFHPTKNATEEDLYPYGGGAIMNEIDGNLTLWKGETIKLSQNRVRGPEFEPRFYRIEKLSSPDIVDDKGRQILLPVMRPTTAQDVEEREAAESNTDIAFLRVLEATPEAAQRDLAQAIGLSLGAINKKIKRLEKQKMIEKGLKGYRLTSKAERLLKTKT